MKNLNIIKTIYNVLKNKFITQSQAMIKWKKDNLENELRYDYDLNKNSIVFDIGGYHGQWAKEIFLKYQCNIYIFEPIKSFYEIIKEKINAKNKIFIYNYGLSNKNEAAKISLEENSSSFYKKSKKLTSVKLKNITDFIMENKITQIDLIKINIEGGEYDLVEELIRTGDILKIKNIQVQFHNFIPNAKGRMLNIQENLKKTHHLTYQYEFVWENWAKN